MSIHFRHENFGATTAPTVEAPAQTAPIPRSLFEKKKDMIQALTCLRIETPEMVADAVVCKVMAVIDHLEADIRKLELKIQERTLGPGKHVLPPTQ